MVQREEEDVRGFELVTTVLGVVTAPCGHAAGLLASRGHRQGNSAGPVTAVGWLLGIEIIFLFLRDNSEKLTFLIHSQSHIQIHQFLYILLISFRPSADIIFMNCRQTLLLFPSV